MRYPCLIKEVGAVPTGCATTVDRREANLGRLTRIQGRRAVERTGDRSTAHHILENKKVILKRFHYASRVSRRTLQARLEGGCVGIMQKVQQSNAVPASP